LVAAIVVMAATQLLMLGFESSPLLTQGQVDSLTGWIDDRPHVATGLLAGIALVLVSIYLIVSIIRSMGTDRRVITTRRRHGWTRFDCSTLEDAVERKLAAVDRRNDVTAHATRRGRIDLSIVTPDPTAMGPARELREALDDYCTQRTLPCRSGRVTATTPRRMTKRRRIR